MITDPISDLIVRLKNGSDARKSSVEIFHSKFAEKVAHAMKKAGYVSSIEKKNKSINRLEIGLVYLENGEPRIHGVERLSKPSRRIYRKSGEIRTYKSGFGNSFLSTPRGVLVDMDAKKHKVGGEILFRIW